MNPRSALRVILGDQISEDRLSSLRGLGPDDLVLFAEVHAEATYVHHHKQKIALVFAAMRAMALRLRHRGIAVRYVRIDDPDNTHGICSEVRRALAQNQFSEVVITEPGEWRLREEIAAFASTIPVPLRVCEDDRFICSHQTFANWAAGRSQLRMESFYRMMRERTGLLMEADGPVGGQWNFDPENRKRLPNAVQPPPHVFVPPDENVREAIEDVARLFPEHFGNLEGFAYPTTPESAERVVSDFLLNILPGFGDYQDAMAAGEPWMWHAIISAAMNLGLIDPLDVCRRAEQAYRDGRAPLNSVEGFIRQIIGWREFVRGIYWLKMPEYKARNVLEASEPLPWFYWSGETDMACVRDVVRSTRDHAYAHHIQRLMVTGNLAMLLGVAPDAINDWYMVVFADAYEWVELPNTHGMATFADGGIVGSKPYAASGAYINRMSDYCRSCTYDVRKGTGEDACPFNALYWDFLIRHRKRVGSNARMAMPYRNLDRMSERDRADIARQADHWRAVFRQSS